VYSECTLHISIVLAICAPKIITFGGDLMKFQMTKTSWVIFWHTLYMSPAICDHPVLPATRHIWIRPIHNPSQTGRCSIYLPRRDGRLSWPWCRLYTEMVYLSADSHPPSRNHLIASSDVDLTIAMS